MGVESDTRATYLQAQWWIRAARAFTGKQKVGLFDGSHHGVHDYALVKVDGESDRSRPTATILGNGVPRIIAEDLTVTLPYRDETAFEIIREQKDELAMVMIEPVQSANPRLDAGSMFHLVFTGGEINSSRDITKDWQVAEREFYLHLLGHNVIIPGIHLAFLSYAHKPEHVDAVIDAFRNSFEDMRSDGII